MVESVKSSTTNPQAVSDLLKGLSTLNEKATRDGSTYEPKGREIHDTVDISDGLKVVNLARGDDLAAEIRQQKDPSKLADMIKEGSADVSRVTNLFREVFVTLRSLFGGR